MSPNGRGPDRRRVGLIQRIGKATDGRLVEQHRAGRPRDGGQCASNDRPDHASGQPGSLAGLAALVSPVSPSGPATIPLPRKNCRPKDQSHNRANEKEGA